MEKQEPCGIEVPAKASWLRCEFHVLLAKLIGRPSLTALIPRSTLLCYRDGSRVVVK